MNEQECNEKNYYAVKKLFGTPNSDLEPRYWNKERTDAFIEKYVSELIEKFKNGDQP